MDTADRFFLIVTAITFAVILVGLVLAALGF